MARRRIIAIALLVACIVFAAALFAVDRALPAQSYVGDENKDYGYVYSGVKSSSVDFTTASMADDALLLFGSSELSTPPSLVPQVPASTFGMRDCGVDLMYIGEAYDQSLWHAIAAGAYAPRLKNKKVVIVASPVWFADGGLDNDLFKTRFSYSLYRSFMANDAISETTRAYVQKRLAEQGIDSAVVAAGAADNPLAIANDFVFAAIDDLGMRSDLRELRKKGFEHPTGDGQPIDFAAVRARALDDAKERSHNAWGFDDEFYRESIEGQEEAIRGKLAGETYSDTPEYDDFGLFLRVCSESGLQPLVVISPLSGDYYDWTGIDAQTRASSYEHIRTIAEAYGARVADFSSHEYEVYFLHDQVHFGWLGWVDVEQAIYEFAREGA